MMSLFAAGPGNPVPLGSSISGASGTFQVRYTASPSNTILYLTATRGTMAAHANAKTAIEKLQRHRDRQCGQDRPRLAVPLAQPPRPLGDRGGRERQRLGRRLHRRERDRAVRPEPRQLPAGDEDRRSDLTTPDRIPQQGAAAVDRRSDRFVRERVGREQDVRDQSLSYAQGAGGIVASLEALTRWARALYEGRVLAPRQQAELESLVSMKTGRPIARTIAAEPNGFGLGVVQGFSATQGRLLSAPLRRTHRDRAQQRAEPQE
jgi:hypothetical protein